MKKIRVDLFEQNVLLFNSYDDLEKFCNRKGYDFEDVEEYRHSAIGLSGLLKQSDSEVHDFFILVESPDISVITHECVHCAMFMLHFMGVPYCVDNQEMLAFTTGHLFKEYCKAFKVVPTDMLTHDF